MGPDSVPEKGVELIIRPIARMAGRRHSKKHSQKHRFYLMKTGTCMRTFHIAQVPIHRDILRDSKLRLKGDAPLRYHLGCNFGRDPDGTLFLRRQRKIWFSPTFGFPFLLVFESSQFRNIII